MPNTTTTASRIVWALVRASATGSSDDSLPRRAEITKRSTIAMASSSSCRGFSLKSSERNAWSACSAYRWNAARRSGVPLWLLLAPSSGGGGGDASDRLGGLRDHSPTVGSCADILKSSKLLDSHKMQFRRIYIPGV